MLSLFKPPDGPWILPSAISILKKWRAQKNHKPISSKVNSPAVKSKKTAGKIPAAETKNKKTYVAKRKSHNIRDLGQKMSALDMPNESVTVTTFSLISTKLKEEKNFLKASQPRTVINGQT